MSARMVQSLMHVQAAITDGLAVDGDVTVADDDGVCVIPRATAADIHKKALVRPAGSIKAGRMGKGEIHLTIYNMRRDLAAKCLKHV